MSYKEITDNKRDTKRIKIERGGGGGGEYTKR